MDAHAELDLIVGNRKLALPDSGTTHGVNATPIERHASAALRAAAVTSASEAPSAARELAILNA